jgi:hypothetical protein
MDGGQQDGARWRWPVVAAVVLAVLLAVAVPVWLRGDESEDARDDSGECTATLRATDVRGDLRVPAGETCRLLGIAVHGRTTVGEGATLYARSTYFLGGLHARGHERVEIVSGEVEGRSDYWGAEYQERTRAVIEDGGDVVLRAGSYTDYVIRDNTGRIEVVGIYFDLGSANCRGNTRKPVVRGISAETPGVLQGQCAGLKHFGQTDF